MNNLVEWTEELSIGLQEIDEQHKILIKLLNELYQAITDDAEQTVINNTLRELVHYTVVHFAVEESLMRIFDYPVYDEHKKHHEELTHQLVEFRNGLKQADFSLSADAVNFLSGWLMKHILMDDKKYGPFLLEKGLKKSWNKQTWTGKIWHFMHK